MIASIPIQLGTGDTSILVEALADSSGGFVTIVLERGGEEFAFSLDWSDAELVGRGIVSIANEAKLSEREYSDAESRHESIGTDVTCGEDDCPVCG
jgi:hypothetical protein